MDWNDDEPNLLDEADAGAFLVEFHPYKRVIFDWPDLFWWFR